MNFRDMGPFEDPPYTHVNMDFYLSDPPPLREWVLVEEIPVLKGVTINYRGGGSQESGNVLAANL